MSQMTGKDWVVVVLIAVLAVLLSTMSSWWGQLVFTVGFKMALLIVAIVIAILVIAIIAMMIAAPDWWDNLFNSFNGNIERLLHTAGKGVEIASDALVGVTAHVIQKLGFYALLGGAGYLCYRTIISKKERSSYAQNNSRNFDR